MDKMDKKKEEIIRRIAYRIYQERQRLGLPGDALSDWLKAEEEYKKIWQKANIKLKVERRI